MGGNKILYIIDTLQIGGAEKSILEIVPRFTKYIPIICSVYKGNALQKAYTDAGIKVFTLNIEGRFEYAKAVRALLHIIHNENVQLIHTTLYRSDIIGRKLKKLTGLTLVNSFVNNSYSKERYRNTELFDRFKLFYYQIRDRITACQVDLFISNSECIRRTNSKALNIDLSKSKVIYRGRDFEHYYNISKASHNKIFNILPANKKYIINVSRLLSRKGQADLIKAFSLLDPEIQENHILIIAGEGAFRAELESIIEYYGLKNYVYLLGNIKDIPALLQLASCFVFPSYYEGLPGALIEAMMAGNIIIASDIAENRECVDDACAIFFKRGNLEELATAMGRVLSDPHSFQNLGERARDLAIEKFEISKIAKQYEETYNMLLSK